jgi:carboxyl-terminal processing protease
LGDDAGYEQDMLTRYEHGEFFSQDSIKHTGPAYYTSIGRTVYGGGGITPDIFVPEDTTNLTSYYKEAAMSGLILQFAFNYTDENRLRLKKFEDMPHLVNYLKQQNLVEKFANYADHNGLKRRNLMIMKSHSLLDRFINSRIVYNILDEQAWNEFLNKDDPTIKKALEVFRQHAAFPKKPAKSSPKAKTNGKKAA